MKRLLRYIKALYLLMNYVVVVKRISFSQSDDVLLILWVFQLHAGLAEVAAAKARMFVNKPDGSMYF